MEAVDIAPNTYVPTADPVCMGRKSCQCRHEYSCTGATLCPCILTGSAVLMHLAQYPRPPFCVLFYCMYNLLFYGAFSPTPFLF